MGGREQIVLSGNSCVASYDPDNGSRLWMIDDPTEQFVASPVYSDTCGLIFITGGFPDHHILAIRLDGTGNSAQTHIAWRTTRGVAYVPSPIIEGEYFLTWREMLRLPGHQPRSDPPAHGATPLLRWPGQLTPRPLRRTKASRERAFARAQTPLTVSGNQGSRGRSPSPGSHLFDCELA